ncbi:MAG: ISL3 family transposase [Acidobacteriaceae bacterium]|nr:ISL3 family transposase [Acidobacteriaceae bacterium]
MPDATALALDQVQFAPEFITLTVRTTAAAAPCPQCQHESTRVHSRYRRTLSDVPCTGLTLCLKLRLRRFFCQQPYCARRIFAERLPTVAAPYARRTHRLSNALRLIGFALGGEAGARTAAQLGLPTSPDTLLRTVRRSTGTGTVTPRVLGVDDWSYKRGERYGTILCDLERHRVVDLLPDRSAESLAAWLRAHPGVEVISRDRSSLYAEGAREGAPEAVQVADRWHLMKNLTEALERILQRHHTELRQAHQQISAATVSLPPTAAGEPAPTLDTPPALSQRQEETRQHRRDRRRARYEEVIALHQEGYSQREIARRLGLGQRTVRRWVQARSFPEQSRRRRRSRLDRFRPYLEQRWQDGIRNVARLWRELRKQGFTGGYSTVKDWFSRHRPNLPVTAPSSAVKRSAPPSPRQAAWWVLREPADRTPEQQAFVEQLDRQAPALADVAAQGRAFLDLIRKRQEEQLTPWMERAAAGSLRHFVERLRQDEDAVRAALRLPWSNGPVEGPVHRLKLLKRQMYGRAKFDLLRGRVLFQI